MFSDIQGSRQDAFNSCARRNSLMNQEHVRCVMPWKIILRFPIERSVDVINTNIFIK